MKRNAVATTVLLLTLFSVGASAQTTTLPLAWGSNSAGQLGFPNPTTDRYPGVVSGLGAASNVIKLASAGGHTLALKSDGTVLAWGVNSVGQLGDGTTITRLTPVQVKDPSSGTGILTDVIAIAAGDANSLAIKSDGTVLAWGGGGTLGDGTKTNRPTPVQVVGLGPGSGVVALAAGGHTLALKADGTVLAWGGNVAGQLGDGTTNEALTPVPVSGLGSGKVTAIAAATGSAAYSLALKEDGTVLAWGGNAQGELGDGTKIRRPAPVQVSGLGSGSGVVAIATGGGSGFSLALLGSGSVLTWGDNSSGQLGDGSNNERLTPGVVPGLSGIVAIGAGASHTMALRGDGVVLSWGDNTYGQLGDGTVIQRKSPVQVSSTSGAALTGVASIAVPIGSNYNLALKVDGTVLAWGINSSGQLGNGQFYGRTVPTPIAGFEGIVRISAGAAHTLALRVDGSVWAWGSNPDGRLGDGTVVGRSTPAQVVGLGQNSGVVSISAGTGGSGHNLVLKSDGSVLAWGGNLLGGLGDGTIVDKWTPIPVNLGPGSRAIKVVAGMGFSMALLSDGTVLTWGNNLNAQLGDGHPEFSYRMIPVQVSGLGPGSGVVDIAAGGGHGLALKSDGTVLAWGVNSSGQLGDGTLVKRYTPVQVSGIEPGSGIVAVFAMAATSGALKSDGSVLRWGGNGVGQLGDGTTTNRNTPVQVLGLGPGSGVVGVAASGTLALKSDGTVLAWGDNSSGALGNGTLEGPKLTPIQPLGLGPGSGIVAVAAGGGSFALPRLSITGLTNLILDFALQPGIQRGLLAKLDAAQDAVERGDERAANGILDAFVHLTEAQRGKAMTNEQASLLTSYANALTSPF